MSKLGAVCRTLPLGGGRPKAAPPRPSSCCYSPTELAATNLLQAGRGGGVFVFNFHDLARRDICSTTARMVTTSLARSTHCARDVSGTARLPASRKTTGLAWLSMGPGTERFVRSDEVCVSAGVLPTRRRLNKIKTHFTKPGGVVILCFVTTGLHHCGATTIVIAGITISIVIMNCRHCSDYSRTGEFFIFYPQSLAKCTRRFKKIVHNTRAHVRVPACARVRVRARVKEQFEISRSRTREGHSAEKKFVDANDHS